MSDFERRHSLLDRLESFAGQVERKGRESTDMADAHWERVKEIARRAMELAPEKREFVDEECGVEPELRTEVRA